MLGVVQCPLKCKGWSYCYLNNGINRTGLLAEAAVDTFRHINVITCGSPAAIGSSLSFNSDGLHSTQEEEGID